MEAIRQGTIDKANAKLAKHITDFLMQFEKLERTTDNQLLGWCGGDAYFIKINVAISTGLEKADISKIA